MYGLAKEKDLGFMLNKELLQVCIGLNEVLLNFDAEMSILLQCPYEVIPSSGLRGRLADQPQHQAGSAVSLLPLIGSKIAGVENQGEGRLVLFFSNGSSLIIQEDDAPYESYQITTPEQRIIV